MNDYIERAVADIARKCHVKQDEVWVAMKELSNLQCQEWHEESEACMLSCRSRQRCD